MIHGKESFGCKSSTCCPLVLAEVTVYPAQVAATICESFLLAAHLSSRDPPGEDLSPPIQQHHARARCLDSTMLKPSVSWP